MQQKAFLLQNLGMNRDSSVSKMGESSVYDNHNIRIIVNDKDSVLTVTNERGTKEIPLESLITGVVVGWNVCGNNLILFTTLRAPVPTAEPVVQPGLEYSSGIPVTPIDNPDNVQPDNPIIIYSDNIYRLEYVGDQFIMHGWHWNSDDDVYEECNYGPLYGGNLGFDIEHPVESVCYYESEDIQKIYWVDGIHPLRFINYATHDPEERKHWDDPTYFDSNRAFDPNITVQITKDNAGNPRPNGVTQYFLTYFDMYGQESGCAWTSDLIYLSPLDYGGAPDETNLNRVLFTFSNLDTRFTHFRLYSLFRSSLNGDAVAYLVHESKVGADPVQVVDDGAHLSSEDPNRLLFLGSRDVRPGTLAQKDNTLFLGDLTVTEKTGLDAFETLIRDTFVGENYLTFIYSDDSNPVIPCIPYSLEDDNANGGIQLMHSSSEITMFKGGELYRFALVFYRADGSPSDAFWIGDYENGKYPAINTSGASPVIKRPLAQLVVPTEIVREAKRLGFVSVQLQFAEATYADRSVKAQGIINPTMFNVWSRYNDQLYAMPSWISRPRNSSYAFKHFEAVHHSKLPTGEIECSYWDSVDDNGAYIRPRPLYNQFIASNDPLTYKYDDPLIAEATSGYLKIVYAVECHLNAFQYRKFSAQAMVITADAGANYAFTDADIAGLISTAGEKTFIKNISGTDVTFNIRVTPKFTGGGTYSSSRSDAWVQVTDYIKNTLSVSHYITEQVMTTTWFGYCGDHRGDTFYFNYQEPDVADVKTTWTAAMNIGSWIDLSSDIGAGMVGRKAPAAARKHLMFVDENLVTLDSPEIAYGASSFDKSDNCRFRIIGAVRISSSYSDYTVDATHGYLAGNNLAKEYFGGRAAMGSAIVSGLISWPLWEETGLVAKARRDDDSAVPDEIRNRVPSDYNWGGPTVRYWLHMWSHPGKITGFTDKDNSDYSELKKKVFANFRRSSETIYAAVPVSFGADKVRIVNGEDSRLLAVTIGSELRSYSGYVTETLTMPNGLKYPILFSKLSSSITPGTQPPTDEWLFTSAPNHLSFKTCSHAVVTLGTTAGLNSYQQEALPYCFDSEDDRTDYDPGQSVHFIKHLVPWLPESSEIPGNFIQYTLSRSKLNVPGLLVGEPYLLLGEIYQDFNGDDTRYGGTSESAIASCRFIPSGPIAVLANMHTTESTGWEADNTIFANQGDTYFQRWNCLRSMPNGGDSSVIDITSFMVETHINVDGVYDKQKNTKLLASIDSANYGRLNPVYTQSNNFKVSYDLDNPLTIDRYKNVLTWTLPKANNSSVDEWTRINLATSASFDGDKGELTALRRFGDNLYAFQERGIAEVLFNKRTQISTEEGVPIEIANSNKMDGFRYLTNRYGCKNKWSITEGKRGIYFIDDLNKMFCSFDGSSVREVSTQKNFSTWFQQNLTNTKWTPGSRNASFISFYDPGKSDVYLARGAAMTGWECCLAYNEWLDAFTSFFDYSAVPVMTRVGDRFVAVKSGKLWGMNEGEYCNFFGDGTKPFWMEYKITPDPFGDKIWTNVEYRADALQAIVGSTHILPISEMQYLPDVTFDSIKVWNEYQSTGDVPIIRTQRGTYPDVRKKYRIWRLDIGRAVENNVPTRDRIRNPWIYMRLTKDPGTDANYTKTLMQIHDVIVRYYE